MINWIPSLPTYIQDNAKDLNIIWQVVDASTVFNFKWWHSWYLSKLTSWFAIISNCFMLKQLYMSQVEQG